MATTSSSSQSKALIEFLYSLDFDILKTLKESAAAAQAFTARNDVDLAEVLKLIDKIQDFAIECGIPEQYVIPDPEYNIIRWPESQEYVEDPSDPLKCSLIVDDYGLAKFGPAAYLVHKTFVHENQEG